MAIYTDAFTGTDGTDLPVYDATWVTITSGVTLEIWNNGATGSSGADCANRYNQTFNSKHYSKAVLGRIAGIGAVGIGIRMQSAANSYFYCYVDPSGPTVFNGERIAGTATDWDAGLTGSNAPAVNDTFGLYVDSAIESTIYFKVNEVIKATYTGKSALSGGQGGVISTGGTDDNYISSWEGGDIAVVASLILVPRIQLPNLISL